jgi:TatD DNase family protein
MYIDTHSHVYLSDFEEDRQEMMERAKANNVQKILLPNIDVSTIQSLNDCVQKDHTLFKGMMGLHPGSVKEDYKEQLERIKKELFDGSFIAVGEIGIDLYWDKSFIEEQKGAFRTQIEWALELDLPIVIHARDSFQEITDILEEYKETSLRGVFHCFSGDKEQLHKALSFANFMLGIGGVLTFKNGGLDKIIHEAPLDRLLLETDAPYLTPAPHRGKRNEPAYIPLIASKLAEVMERSIEHIERITSRNAAILFNLDMHE